LNIEKGNIAYLKEALNKLKKAEIDSLFRFLSCFDSNHKKDRDLLQVQFLEIFLANIHKKEKEIYEELSNTFDSKAISNHAYRIKIRLLDLLILELNKEKYEVSEYMEANLDIKKGLLQLTLLRARNITAEIPHLINLLKAKAEKYELVGNLIEILLFEKEFFSTRSSIKQYNSISGKIQEALKKQHLLEEAFDHYAKLRAIKSTTLQSKDVDKQLQEALAFFSNSDNQTDLASFNYYKFWIQLEELYLKKSYEEALDLCESNLAYIKANPAILSVQRVGINYIQQAKLNIYQERYLAALACTHNAQKYFETDSQNAFTALELEVLSFFYSSQYQQATEKLRELLKENNHNISPFRRGQWKYYLSYLDYLSGDGRKANQDLDANDEMVNDKKGWGIGVKMLKLLIHANNENESIFTSTLESIQRALNDKEESKSIRKRERTILTILRRLKNNNFNFKLTLANSKRELERLVSTEEQYAWEPMSAELIRFEYWFEEQAAIQTSGRKTGYFTPKVMAS